MSSDETYNQLDQERSDLTSLIDQKQVRYSQLTDEITRATAAKDYLTARPLHDERKQLNIDTFRASDARETVVHEMIERFGNDEQRRTLRNIDGKQRADGSGVPRIADHKQK